MDENDNYEELKTEGKDVILQTVKGRVRRKGDSEKLITKGKDVKMQPVKGRVRRRNCKKEKQNEGRG